MGPNKIKWGQWFVKTAVAVLGIAFLMMWAMDKNVTAQEFVEAVASTPFFVILLAEGLDKITDKRDYYKMYNIAYQRMFQGKRNDIAGILLPTVISALLFATVLWMVAGSLVLSTSAYNPALLVWAAVLSLYIIMPETGDDELMLWLWLGATIATKGQNFTILPPQFLEQISGQVVRTLLRA